VKQKIIILLVVFITGLILFWFEPFRKEKRMTLWNEDLTIIELPLRDLRLIREKGFQQDRFYIEKISTKKRYRGGTAVRNAFSFWAKPEIAGLYPSDFDAGPLQTEVVFYSSFNKKYKILKFQKSNHNFFVKKEGDPSYYLVAASLFDPLEVPEKSYREHNLLSIPHESYIESLVFVFENQSYSFRRTDEKVNGQSKRIWRNEKGESYSFDQADFLESRVKALRIDRFDDGDVQEPFSPFYEIKISLFRGPSTTIQIEKSFLHPGLHRMKIHGDPEVYFIEESQSSGLLKIALNTKVEKKNEIHK